MPPVPLLGPRDVVRSFERLGRRYGHALCAQPSPGCAGDIAGVDREGRFDGGRVLSGNVVLEAYVEFHLPG